MLILAIENIFFEWMTTYPSCKKVIKAFGYFLNKDFYVEDLNEVAKIHSYFQTLYVNKYQPYERKRHSVDNLSGGGSSSVKQLLFRPVINSRSNSIIASRKGSLSLQRKLEDVLLDKGRFIEEKLKKKR